MHSRNYRVGRASFTDRAWLVVAQLAYAFLPVAVVEIKPGL